MSTTIVTRTIGRASEEQANWFVRKFPAAQLGSLSSTGERRVVSDATGKDWDKLVNKFQKLKTAVLSKGYQVVDNVSCKPCGQR